MATADTHRASELLSMGSTIAVLGKVPADLTGHRQTESHLLLQLTGPPSTSCPVKNVLRNSVWGRGTQGNPVCSLPELTRSTRRKRKPLGQQAVAVIPEAGGTVPNVIPFDLLSGFDQTSQSTVFLVQ